MERPQEVLKICVNSYVAWIPQEEPVPTVKHYTVCCSATLPTCNSTGTEMSMAKPRSGAGYIILPEQAAGLRLC
jgi:hypothetical protein